MTGSDKTQIIDHRSVIPLNLPVPFLELSCMIVMKSWNLTAQKKLFTQTRSDCRFKSTSDMREWPGRQNAQTRLECWKMRGGEYGDNVYTGAHTLPMPSSFQAKIQARNVFQKDLYQKYNLILQHILIYHYYLEREVIVMSAQIKLQNHCLKETSNIKKTGRTNAKHHSRKGREASKGRTTLQIWNITSNTKICNLIRFPGVCIIGPQELHIAFVIHEVRLCFELCWSWIFLLLFQWKHSRGIEDRIVEDVRGK